MRLCKKLLGQIIALVLFALVLTCAAPSHAVADSGYGSKETAAVNNQFGRHSEEAAITLPVELVEERSPIAQEPIAGQRAALSSEPPKLEEVNGGGNSDSSDLGADKSDRAGVKTTVLNVKDADITTLVKIFSKLTRRNYIVDSNVKGKVTIHLPSAVTIDEALKIFDSVLLIKGFTAVPVGENVWKIITTRDAKQTTIPLLETSPDTPSDALVTQLIRLKYVQSSDIQQLLSQFISKDGVLNAYSGTNALIAIDSAANIKRLGEIISELDVPATDQDITIVPVLHATADDIADKINEILGGKEDDKDQTARSSAIARSAALRANPALQRRLAAANAASQTKTVETRSLPFKVIPNERTNSIIIVADQEQTVKVRALIEQLDSQFDLSGGRFYVYRLKHADAEEVSDILERLISGSSDSESSASSSRGSSISRSRTQTTSDRNSVSQRISQALSRRATVSGSNSQNEGKVNFEGEVAVAADPATNSLIINASRSDYGKVKEVLAALDVKRRQVLVEATILEISISKDEGMGIELQGTAGEENKGGIFAQTNYGGLTNLFTNPAGLSDLTIAAASSGTITLPGGLTIPSQAILVSALSRNSNVNVLSSPTIMATDNEEAEIIVGENVPFVSSTSTDPTNLNNTFNQIERQDVGITLRITPQISEGDFVTLKIFVEISNVVAATRNDPNGPTTTIRTTETNVQVKDAQMVVTGGLIADNVTESTRGVPFLQDIPVLGHYFKREDVNQRRTNLLVFITPRIIKDQFDAREQSKDRSVLMQEEISSHEIQPQRYQVLEDPDLDNVVDSIPSGEIFPSTITPPSDLSKLSEHERGALERTKKRLELLQKSAAKRKPPEAAPSSDEDEVIDIRVAPKLPSDPKENAQARPSFTSGDQPIANNLSLGKTFVVLRSLSKTSSSTSTGVSLIEPMNSSAGQFFVVGGRYKHKAKGLKEQEYVCLGKYASIDEAKVVHPELENPARWQLLSPQETVQLGQSSWIKG